MTSTNLTEVIAQQIVELSYEDLPNDVIEIAKMCLLDNLGCAMSGVNEPLSKILGEELAGEPTTPADLLPNTEDTLRSPDWAMRYAATAHALDYDDTYVPGQASHAGNVVTGAVLAVLRHHNISGKEVITAVVAAYEAAARIGELLTPEHYLNGFHPTCTVGSFTAAAVTSKLMGFDVQQTQAALGIAGTQASGLKCVFGSMTKPFNAGNAAASGIIAASLVKRGYTAPLNILEADKGYLDMFLGKPKEDWQIAPVGDFKIRGNLFKFYAACHATHPVIEALKEIQAERTTAGKTIAPNDVDQLHIEVTDLSLKTASIIHPKQGLQSKFSFPQIAAFVLCGINPSSNSAFTDDMLGNDAVNTLRQRITVEISDELDIPFNVNLKLTLKSGEVIDKAYRGVEYFSSIRLEQLPTLQDKFVANASESLTPRQAKQLLAGVLSITESANARESFSIC